MFSFKYTERQVTLLWSLMAISFLAHEPLLAMRSTIINGETILQQSLEYELPLLMRNLRTLRMACLGCV